MKLSGRVLVAVAIVLMSLLTHTGCGRGQFNEVDHGIVIVDGIPINLKNASLAEDVFRQKVVVASHRGDAKAKPENTVPAFSSSVKKGFSVVELDTQVTKDGKIVILHDKTLRRTTDVEQVFDTDDKKVKQLTLEQIKKLDAGFWKSKKFKGTKIPTLTESFAAIAPHSVVLIDRKTGSAQLYAKYITENRIEPYVIVQSFNWKFLQELKQLVPSVNVMGLAHGKMTDKKLQLADDLGFTAVVWHYRSVTEDSVNKSDDAGLRLWVYTVNKSSSFHSLKDFGVQGFITDTPTKKLKVTTTQT